MHTNDVFNILSVDKPGVFPSKKYFKEHGANIEERLILLEFFVNTNQITKPIVCDIFAKLKKHIINVDKKHIMQNIKENMSEKQIMVLMNTIEETYNNQFASTSDLYTYPTLVEYIEAKKTFLDKDKNTNDIEI